MKGATDRSLQIIALWESGVRVKKRIAEAVGCSTSNVTQVLARHEQSDGRAAEIMRLWKHTNYSADTIARKMHVSAEYVLKIAAGARRQTGRTCPNPKLEKNLEACGQPLHQIGGETLGCCKECWDTLKPISGQKSVINGQRASRRYG